MAGLLLERQDHRPGERVADDGHRVDSFPGDRLERCDRVEATVGESDHAAAVQHAAQRGEKAGSVHQWTRRQRDPPHQEFVELGLHALDAARQVEGIQAAVVADVPEIVQPPHDALGHAGRAARVQKPQVVAAARPGCSEGERVIRRRGRGLLVGNRPIGTRPGAVVDPQPGVDLGDLRLQRLDPRREAAVEDHRHDIRVVPQVKQLALDVAVVRVHRHQGGLEAGEHRLQVLRDVVQVLRHLVLARRTARDQSRGHAVRPAMHFGPRVAAARGPAQRIDEGLRGRFRLMVRDRFQDVRVMPVAHGRRNLAADKIPRYA